MNNFTKSELIKSLILPVGTFLFGAVGFLGELMYSNVFFTGFNGVRTFYYPMSVMLFGGVLPVILTLRGNIHTERYFFKRLWVYLFCYVFVYIGGMLPYGILNVLWHIMTAAGNVVWCLLKVQDEDTTGGERAVMFLSDFYLWYVLDYCLMMFADLAGMPFVDI